MKSHQIYPPHPALKDYVRYYWSLDLQLEGEALLDLQLTADRFPVMVVQCLDGKNALHESTNDSSYPASLKGITAKPSLLQMESRYSHIAVFFYPHGLNALFGIDAHETTNALIDLRHFFPPDLIEQIIVAADHQRRIDMLNVFLLKQLSLHKPTDRRVSDFVHQHPQAKYRSLLKEYGISERQFERKFLQAVGFTPSFYKRVLRFEQAFHRVQSGNFISLVDLALELGYSDQSHFNREFKQFSTFTPVRLLSKEKILTESGSVVSE